MNNILEKTKTYLIGAMQYENGEKWRDKIQSKLIEMGIIVFNPYHKPFIKDVQEGDVNRIKIQKLIEEKNYDEVQKIMKEIRSYDLNLVDRSDFIIAHINPNIPTIGSIEELTTACRMKKPTFISIEGGKQLCPWWIFGMFPHKYIYNSIDDILNILMKIDSGEKEIDSNRWRLLKKEYR
jgi:nucleoside 2-deoxyribosyltransferase